MNTRKRRVRIVHDGGDPLFFRVEDADTGRQVHGVKSVVYTAGLRETTAVVEIVAEIDVVVEAELRRLRLNDETGDYELLEERP